MKFKPILTSNVQDNVYEQLADGIVSGRIHPGSRLTLEAMASQLGVSVMPVREAFRRLEANKLVKRENNRSIKVTRLSIENIREILSLRLMLESYAAGKAALLCSVSTLQILGDLDERMEKTDDVDTYLQLNRDFHFAVYESAELPILLEMIGSLWERYSPYLYILHRTDKNWKSEMLMKNHRGIIEAMREKDEEKTKHWLRLDLEESGERIDRMMEGRTTI